MRLRTWCPVVIVFLFNVLAAEGAVFGRLHIVAASTDPGHGGSLTDDKSCRLEPSPQVMYLKVGHVHEISVESSVDAPQWYITNKNVATIEGTGRTVHIVGIARGQAEVVVSVLREGRVERATLSIRGVSSRYTVVGWLDGSEIRPQTVAPSASRALKDDLNGPLCSWLVVVRWLAWGSPTDIVTDADRLYAKAFLLSSASNPEPPPEIDDGYSSQVKQYKLYNDYQVDADDSVIHQSALMGETPSPCRIPKSASGDRHPNNDSVFWNENQTMLMHLNEARIGREAQRILRVIDPRGPSAGWIWSLVAVDKKGTAKARSAGFPSFRVYRDGVVCGEWKQEDLARFLKAGESSEVKLGEARRLKPEDLEEACTYQLR